MSTNSVNLSEFFIFMKSKKFLKQAVDKLEEGQAVLACHKFALLLSALSASYKKQKLF